MLRLLHVVTTTGSMICAWDMFCYLYGDHVSYIVCMRSCANGFNPVALCLSINFIYNFTIYFGSPNSMLDIKDCLQ